MNNCYGTKAQQTSQQNEKQTKTIKVLVRLVPNSVHVSPPPSQRQPNFTWNRGNIIANQLLCEPNKPPAKDETFFSVAHRPGIIPVHLKSRTWQPRPWSLEKLHRFDHQPPQTLHQKQSTLHAIAVA